MKTPDMTRSLPFDHHEMLLIFSFRALFRGSNECLGSNHSPSLIDNLTCLNETWKYLIEQLKLKIFLVLLHSLNQQHSCLHAPSSSMI